MENSQADNNRPAAAPGRRFDPGRLLTAIASGPLSLLGVSFVLGLVFLLIRQAFPSLQLNELSGEAERIFNVVTSGIIYAGTLAFMVFGLRRYLFGQEPLKSILGLQLQPSWRDAGYALLAFGAYLLTSIVVTTVVSFVPGFNAQQVQDVGQARPELLSAFIVAFIGLVVLPPIFEELILRGFMFKAIRRQLSFWISAVLVSAAFGALHGQLNVAVDTFVLSMYLCYLRERTGAIWAPVILHALKNGLAFTLLFVLGAT